MWMGVSLQKETFDVKKERKDDEEKLAAADSGSMDACMELLYGGGEGNTSGAGDAVAASADTAQEGSPVIS